MPIILLASARGQGNTRKVAEVVARTSGAVVVDLNDYRVHPFSYDQTYPANDTFIKLIKRLLEYDEIIFASPVYWYSMSGPLKIFFDRLSDLLKSRKETGRRLRGKTMSVISCANDAEITPTFYAAFRLSADYLGMAYGREWHGWVEGGKAVLLRRN